MLKKNQGKWFNFIGACLGNIENTYWTVVKVSNASTGPNSCDVIPALKSETEKKKNLKEDVPAIH